MIFVNLMYPSNKDRAARLEQLGEDCANLTAELGSNRDQIDLQFRTLNKLVADAFSKIHVDNVKYEYVEFDGSSWAATVASAVLPSISLPFIMDGMMMASRAYLLNAGRIGEAAFAPIAGLPTWVGMARIGGGLATFAIATAALDAIIDAIDGAVQRSELRTKIKELIEPRRKLKKGVLLTDQVILSLSSIQTAIETIMEDGKYTEADINRMISSLNAKNIKKIEAITDSLVVETLARFDKDRNAWTEDDNC
jgi:hypothetical protein